MGFNKRFVNETLILSVYTEFGIKGVIKLYNADALIHDELSEKIYYFINENKLTDAIDLINSISDLI